MCVYIYIYMYVCIYIYIERERERERGHPQQGALPGQEHAGAHKTIKHIKIIKTTYKL